MSIDCFDEDTLRSQPNLDYDEISTSNISKQLRRKKKKNRKRKSSIKSNEELIKLQQQ